ncbi:MAG: 50S ribosomal protein L11 methyltransferase [Janthinobacterium lividum]
MTDMPNLWLLTFTSSYEQAEHLAAILENHALSVSWFENTDDMLICWQLNAIFAEEPDADWLNFLLADQDYTLSPLPNNDWLQQNRQSFPILHIGQFYIYGSHHDQEIPKTGFSFKIDAATAFGTGQHGTTQGCLLALEDLKTNDLKINNFLDLGCGTAILAMAMAKLFDVQGIAADNDPEAIDMTRYNLIENKLDNQIKTIVSQGFNHPDLHQSFDLIAANILATPLIQLSKDMTQYITNGGHIVLSGLLQTQQNDVENAYISHGFSLIKTYPQDEWTTLVMKKEKSIQDYQI